MILSIFTSTQSSTAPTPLTTSIYDTTQSQASTAPIPLTTSIYDAITLMLTFYNHSTGYFGDPKVYWPFWHTGNTLETLALALELTGDVRIAPILANSFSKVRVDYHTPYCGNDDIQWHAHAWLRAWEATGNLSYLEEAQFIYSDNMLFSPTWAIWNETCGGCNWAENSRYVNTITNSLFTTGMARLARINSTLTTNHGGRGSSVAAPGGATYSEWALRGYVWGQRPGLRVNGVGPYVDGVAVSDCSTPVGSQWTYNAGAWLDGWTSLAVITNDTTFSLDAVDLFTSSITAFENAQGIMLETSCNATSGYCNEPDGRMFKGVFARHVALALRDWAQSGGAAENNNAVQMVKNWAQTNSNSLLTNGMSPSSNLLGQLWQGPYNSNDNTPWVAHSAGIDLLLAAYTAEFI